MVQVLNDRPGLVMEFKGEKATKNTIKHAEIVADNEPEAVGALYVQKWAMARIGNPDKIRVTIEAIK